MTEIENFKEKIQDCYHNFLIKENQIRHFTMQITTMNEFESYIVEKGLLKEALKYMNRTVESYSATKKTLKDYDRELINVNDEMAYRLCYQNFEEFIYDILCTIYSIYPAFLKKESDILQVSFESVLIQQMYHL